MVSFSSVLCIFHILHFFTDLGIGGPLNVGRPGCSPVSTRLHPPLLLCSSAIPINQVVWKELNQLIVIKTLISDFLKIYGLSPTFQGGNARFARPASSPQLGLKM